jgi:hypothetical protein
MILSAIRVGSLQVCESSADPFSGERDASKTARHWSPYYGSLLWAVVSLPSGLLAFHLQLLWQLGLSCWPSLFLLESGRGTSLVTSDASTFGFLLDGFHASP